jgi:hypothetical protein
MNILGRSVWLVLLLCFTTTVPLLGNKKNLAIPPNLPANIPPPPSFLGSSSKIGRYQIVSAEYYSQDTKPFLYKRLVKIDTTTGQAWVLQSKVGTQGEIRTWVPLENK